MAASKHTDAPNRPQPAGEPIPFKVDADTFEMHDVLEIEKRAYPLLINPAASNRDILSVAEARLRRMQHDFEVLRMVGKQGNDDGDNLQGFAWNLSAQVDGLVKLVGFVADRCLAAEKEARP